MATLREVTILERWLDGKIDDVNTLIDAMTVTELREYQHSLVGLIDHLASEEGERLA